MSSSKQDRGFSPEAQREEIEAYVRQHGWERGELFRDTMQGTRDDRPDYQRLLDQVRYVRKQGRHVVVVAAALDRTGRDLAELFAMRKALRLLGVTLHYTRDGGAIDDDSAMLKGWQASKKNEELSKQVSASKRVVAEKGLPPSGPAPWGYRWRWPQGAEEEIAERRRRDELGRKLGKRVKQVRRILEEHPDEAPRVRELFARAAAGEHVMSLVKWAATLTDEERGGRRLGQYPIKRVLSSPTYVARYDRDGGEEATPETILALPQGTWPALVDDGTWAEAQRQIALRSRLPAQARGVYALTGFIRCPRCGCRMSGHGGPYRRYTCQSINRGNDLAARRCYGSVSADKIEAAVFSQVGDVLDQINDPEMRPAVAHAWEAMHGPAAEMAAELRSVEERIARLKGRLVRAREDLYDEKIDDEEYSALTARARAALAEEEARRRQLASGATARAAPETFEDSLARAGTWGEQLRDPDVSVEARRLVLAELIESVEPVQFGSGKAVRYDAKIDWSGTGEALREMARVVNTSSA